MCRPTPARGARFTAGNNFQLNDPVTYRAPSTIELSSLAVELQTGPANKPVVDGDNNPQYVDDTIFLGSDPDLRPGREGEFKTGHGLVTGAAFAYQATGGNGSSIFLDGVTSRNVWVIVVDAFRIRLADTYCHALGTAGDPIACPAAPGSGSNPPVPQQVVHLALNPDRSADASSPTPVPGGASVKHVLTPRSSLGLVDGRVYFAIPVSGSSFKLAAEIDGPALGITATTGVVRKGRHTFAVEGVDLTSAGTITNGDLHQLVIDLTSRGTGIQRLQGVGGASNVSGAPAGDKTTTASGSGAGGGVVDVTAASATATVVSTVEHRIGTASISAKKITIKTDNQGKVAATTASSGGGLVSVGSADATANATTSTTIDIATGATLSAIDDVTIDALAGLTSNVKTSTSKGGLGAGVHANSSSTLSHSTNTTIGGTINAGKTIDVGSTTSVNAVSSARAYGGGLGVDADATSTITVLPSSSTTTTITGTAFLRALHVNVTAIVAPFYASASANSLADAFGADSAGIARVSVGGLAEVRLQPSTVPDALDRRSAQPDHGRRVGGTRGRVPVGPVVDERRLWLSLLRRAGLLGGQHRVQHGLQGGR